MANKTWIGGAAKVAQVWKGTIASNTNAQTFILTITDPYGATFVITYIVANPPDTTATAVATNVAAAWNASQNPLLMAVTASTNGAQVILTADVAGIPFSVAATGTGTWSGTGNTTTNSGPNDYLCAGNWASGVAPVAGGTDNVTITGSSDVLYNIAQSAMDILAFLIAPGCTAKIAQVGRYFQLNCTSLTCSGTGQAYINVGSSAISPRITSTASPGNNQYGLYLLGSALATVTIEGSSSVGVGAFAGETATITTLSADTTGNVMIGPGVTITNYKQVSAGQGYLGCAATLVNADSGILTTFGSGAIGTMNNNGATINPNSSGTITALNRYAGITDFSGSQVSRTVTTDTDYGGSTIILDSTVVTLTNKIAPSGQLKLVSTRV